MKEAGGIALGLEQGAEADLLPLSSGISSAGGTAGLMSLRPSVPAEAALCASELPSDHCSTVPQPGPIRMEGEPCQAAAVSSQIRRN